MKNQRRSLGARIYAGLFTVYGQAQISAQDTPTSSYPDITQGTLTDWEVRQRRDGSSYLVPPTEPDVGPAPST